MVFTVIFWLFTGCLAINCAYGIFLLVGILRLGTAAKVIPTKRQMPVSVVICACNAASALRENLPAVLDQEYRDNSGQPCFTVIVVDDGSTDETAALVSSFQVAHSNLQFISLPVVGARGKKRAQVAGVSAATTEWLVFADADCTPSSRKWLAQMVAPLAGGKEIVAGYSGYRCGTGFVNAFTRWETVHTFLQYSSYALFGMPYMAVGRNMACTRTVYLAASETSVWNALPSGDDDLLVQVAGNSHNTAIVAGNTAQTITEAMPDFSSYMAQKQRHMSTGKYYKPGAKVLLGVYSGAHAATWLGFLASQAGPYAVQASVLIGARCLLVWSAWRIAAWKTGETKLWFFQPVADFVWMVYNFALSPYVFSKDKTTWK